MAFLFYIDGQLTDQPVNDTALATSIKRDSNLRALLVTQDVELAYAANSELAIGTISGYTYLKSLFDDAICNEASIVIYQQISPTQTRLYYSGVIKVPAIIIDLQRFVLSAKVEDNSFYSYINNNKSIQFNPRSTQTKSGQVITACQVYECDMFTPFTFTYGASFGNLFRGYRVSDMFRYVISCMTDNKVGFLSNYLESPPDGIHLFLFDGKALVDENTDPTMTISFNDLLNEIYKLKNVNFYIDASDQANPILRLENSEFFFADAKIIQFDDIKEMKVSSKTSNLYGTVKVGSEILQSGTGQPFNEGTSYYGWKQETYTPIGQCNIDQELNLVNQFAISSNMVSYQLIGAADSNLDTLFIVQMSDVDDVAHTAQAVGFDYFGQGLPRYYNLGINNVNKLQRHGTNFQAALTNTQQIGGDGFRASLGQELLLGTSQGTSAVKYPGFSFNFNQNAVALEPVEFADDFSGNNYDGNNNYSNAGINIGQYLCPADGNYTFGIRFNIDVVNLVSCTDTTVLATTPYQNIPADLSFYRDCNVYYGIAERVTIKCYQDASLTVLISQQETVFSTYVNGQYTIACGFGTLMTAGNVAVVSIDSYLFRAVVGNMISIGGSYYYFNGIIPNTWNTGCAIPNGSPIQVYLSEDSYFECNGTPDGAAVVASNNPSGFMIKQYTFNYPISDDDFELIKLTPIGLFPFQKDDVTLNGWIESMTRNDQTGLTQITLISQADATISN
jgi:hypothetical protein